MENKKLKRVIAISDISGFGKCALSVSIALISVCGVEVLPMPTAVLSANMKFPGFFMRDMTDDTEFFLHNWHQLNITSDAIYTGFIASAEQASIIYKHLSDILALKIVDPIMGDNGIKYRHFSDQLCDNIKKLCSIADIITPNLTEAHILCGKEYSARGDSEYIRQLCGKLRDDGAKTVIITGVERENRLYDCVLDCDGYREHSAELLSFKMSGTGDMFASILCAKLVKGKSIDDSIKIAQNFISYTMQKSREYEDHENRGVCYEPYLHMLMD